MQKSNKINHFGEIFLSSAVLVVVTEIFNWMIKNSDRSFSINSLWFFGAVGGNLFAGIIGLIVLVLAYLYVRRNFVPQVAIILFFSGAIVNLLDRWRFGGTIDYLNLMNIPTFNLPDIYIVVGVAIFIYEAIFVLPKHPNN